MAAEDEAHAGLGVGADGCFEEGAARVIQRKRVKEALLGPGAGEVEAGEVAELGIGNVGDFGGGAAVPSLGRKAVSQRANSSGGRTRRMRSASLRAGEKKSSPEGS